jgi:hypothetical protein
MTVPHIPLEHRVTSGSNPDTSHPQADAVKQLPAGTASSEQSLLLLRRDTNGAGH